MAEQKTLNISIHIIGRRLKELRINLKLTQQEVADAIGVTHSPIISRMESGQGGSIDVLCLLFNYYSAYFDINNILSLDYSISPLKEDIKLNKKTRAKISLTEIEQQKRGIIAQIETTFGQLMEELEKRLK